MVVQRLVPAGYRQRRLVPLCHYSGPKAIQKKIIDGGWIGSMTRRRTVCRPSSRGGGSEDANPPFACSRRSSTKNSGGLSGATSPPLRERKRHDGTDGRERRLPDWREKGMGREMARGLAKEGATIALVARTKPALEELAEELNGLGRRGIAYPPMSANGNKSRMQSRGLGRNRRDRRADQQRRCA